LHYIIYVGKDIFSKKDRKKMIFESVDILIIKK